MDSDRGYQRLLAHGRERLRQALAQLGEPSAQPARAPGGARGLQFYLALLDLESTFDGSIRDLIDLATPITSTANRPLVIPFASAYRTWVPRRASTSQKLTSRVTDQPCASSQAWNAASRGSSPAAPTAPHACTGGTAAKRALQSGLAVADDHLG